MKKEKFLALANGSDIRGIALDGTDKAVNLTEETIQWIAHGFMKWLQENQTSKNESLNIAIGHDGRLSGPKIKGILSDVFTTYGANVIDVGLATTPSLFMATQYEEYACDAGIEITASHLPMEHNGLKFFTEKGGLESTDIEYILDEGYGSDDGSDTHTNGSVIKKDLLTDYAKDLRQKIIDELPENDQSDQPLKGRHIIVDAGNGSAGFFVDKILKPLGAETKGSQFLDSDGNFPNHIPNPDNKEAMASLQNAVSKSGADLGIIFDTDADRAAIVDKDGKSINRNNLIGLASAIALKDAPGGVIVTNSPVSKHVIDFVANLGGEVEPYISGYKNVINRGIELNEEGTNSPLAIETSGHAAFRENYFLDDGSYLIVKILITDAIMQKEGKYVTDLIQELDEPAEAEEIRFVLETEDYQALGKQVIDDLNQFGREKTEFEMVPENKEGVRFNVSGNYGEGWFLLRMSLHEPKLVLQMENDIKDSIPTLKATLEPFFAKYEHVVLS